MALAIPAVLIDNRRNHTTHTKNQYWAVGPKPDRVRNTTVHPRIVRARAAVTMFWLTDCTYLDAP
jgi:hypothetical protein